MSLVGRSFWWSPWLGRAVSLLLSLSLIGLGVRSLIRGGHLYSIYFVEPALAALAIILGFLGLLTALARWNRFGGR